MALKETIGVWFEGTQAFEEGNVEGARDTFLSIADPSARILFNIARVSKLNDSIKYLTNAIAKDPHLAIAYYHRGLHYYAKKQYDRAQQDFNSSEEKMHGRPVLDYSQLGMAFKLHSAEVAITKAAVWQRKGESEKALEIVITASQEAEEDSMKKACVSALQKLKSSSHGALEPISIPKHCIFHPPKSLIANLKKREYVGKARVVSDYQQKSRESSPEPTSRQSNNQPPDLPPRHGNQLNVPPERQRKAQTLPGSIEPKAHQASQGYNLTVDGQKKSATMAAPFTTKHLPPPPNRAAPILNIKDSKSVEDLSSNKQKNSLFVEKDRVRRHSHDIPRELDSQLQKALADHLKKTKGEASSSKDNSDRNGNAPPPRPPRPPPPGIVIESDIPPPVPRKDYPKPR
ncbi:neutrophil cytosol factor 2-like [Ylistrum balloti]|uniref:neutrophil cytosol factor 2-like n=1 Tax=Ylistrum balloti TaxID=509963 RepID=UPI002905A26F|nr:neutrophil cytosol factor 2-like [Ylistrum balloti]